MKSVYPKTKINLVEREEWKDYDTSDKLGNVIFENAASLIDSFNQEGIGMFAQEVMGRSLSDDEDAAIWAAYQSRDPRLEEFQQLLMEAASWSMEEAFIPSDRDINYAIGRALEELPEDDVAWIEEFPSLQELVLSLNMRNPTELINGLLKGIAHLERKKGYYDRFLVYDPDQSEFVEKLKTVPLQPAGGGVLDWMPPTLMYTESIAKELRRWYDTMKEHVVEKTFRMLANHMEHVDYDSRTDFWSMARKRIAEDPKERTRIRKALREILAEQSAEMGANPFFSATPRSRRLAKDFMEMLDLAKESSIFEIKKTEGTRRSNT